MSYRHFFVIGCIVASLGCSDNKRCSGAGGTIAARGAQSDLTTNPGAYSGYILSVPEPCAADSEMISVTGTGIRRLGFPPTAGCDGAPVADGGSGMECPVVNGWAFIGTVKQAMRDATISAYDPWTCSVPGRGILINDWAQSDQAIVLVTQQVTLWDLAETIDIVIGPMLTECY